MPASTRMLLVRWATAGVGTGPQSSTSPPMEQMPETRAFSSMYPEIRVSLPMRMRGTCLLPRPATKVTARPRLRASSGVIGCSLATPRMPSVPNSRRSVGAPGVTGGLLWVKLDLVPMGVPVSHRTGPDGMGRAGDVGLLFLRLSGLAMALAHGFPKLARMVSGDPGFIAGVEKLGFP